MRGCRGHGRRRRIFVFGFLLILAVDFLLLLALIMLLILTHLGHNASGQERRNAEREPCPTLDSAVEALDRRKVGSRAML